MRKKLSKSGSRDLFRATALNRHPLNYRMVPMRGGFRI